MNNSNLSFVDSIINEITIDEYYSKAKGVAESLRRPIMKVSSIPHFLILRPQLLRLILNVFDNFLWWIVYIINLFLLVKIVLERTRVHKYRSGIPPLLGIMTSARLKEQFKKTDLSQEIVYVVWENLKGNDISYLSCLSFKDIFKCYSEANRQISKIRSFYGKYYTLHAIKAFKWLMMREALTSFKTSACFVFCNHYDRWALLIDSFSDHEKILVQHGILNEEVCIKKKLNGINILYCFNPIQYDYFKRFIEKVDSVRFYKSTLILSPVEKDEKLHVLLIGNCVVYKEIEEYFINYFSVHHYNVKLFVKPHPVFPASFYYRLKETCNFSIIENKTFFPEVDYVISYDSTLAFEYEQENIRVLYHNRMEKEDVLKVILSGNK